MKAVSGKMRERGREKKKTQKIVHPYQDIQTRHVEQHGKTRLQHPKFWLRGGQQVKLRHDLNGCPLHFWPSERPDGEFVPRYVYTMQTTTTNFKAFL